MDEALEKAMYSALLLAQRNIEKILKLDVSDNDIDLERQRAFMECEFRDKKKDNIAICIEFLKEGEQYFDLDNRGYLGEDGNIELYQDFYIICIPKVGDYQYWILDKEEMLKALDDIFLKDTIYRTMKGRGIKNNLSVFMKREYYDNWKKLII
jgi:hypothetical protein